MIAATCLRTSRALQLVVEVGAPAPADDLAVEPAVHVHLVQVGTRVLGLAGAGDARPKLSEDCKLVLQLRVLALIGVRRGPEDP